MSPASSTSVWSSRPVRRIVVFETHASYLPLVSLWEPSKALGGAWLAVVLPLGLLTLLGYTLVSVFQISLLWPQPGGALDERQLAVQDRAFGASPFGCSARGCCWRLSTATLQRTAGRSGC